MTVTSLPACRGPSLMGCLLTIDPAAFVDAAAGRDRPTDDHPVETSTMS
jgi:hypothetical protein